MKRLTPETVPPPVPELDEDSGLLDIGDETDGMMEGIQDEVEEGEEGLFIDSRLLQKDFIVKEYYLALTCYRKVGDV